MKNLEKLNHRSAYYRIKNNIDDLLKAEHTFKSIFNISFKNDKFVLFEVVDNVGAKYITYLEAKNNIYKYASYFSKNISKNDYYVGICLENSPSWIYSFYGLLMAGFSPVLLSTRADKKEINNIIKKLKIKNVISDFKYDDVNIINIKDIDNSNFDATFKENWANEIVFMTSGVSSEPKLVSFTGEEITQQITNALPIFNDNRIFGSFYKGYFKHLVILPFYHIFGLMAMFIWFSFLNVRFVLPKDLKSESIKQACMISKVTHIFAVPLFWNTLAKQINKVVSNKHKEKKFNKAIDLSIKIQKAFPIIGPRFVRNVLFKKYLDNIFGNSICFCISGGGSISKATLRIINGLGYPLSNGYGATEIGITSLENSEKISNRLSSTIGFPVDTVTYELDKTLFVSGSSISHKIMSKDKWERVNKINTNDILIKNKNGYFINGRSDNLYISNNGENYSLETYEEKLNLPHCNSYSLIISKDNEIYLILSYPIKPLNLQLIKDLNCIKNDIELSKFIKKIYITTREIPISNGIKIKRRQLEEDFYKYSDEFKLIDDITNKTIVKDVKEDDDQILNKVLSVFTKHFSNSNINVNSNYYVDLKGDSLSYFIIVSELEKEFNCSLNLDKDVPLTPKQFALIIKKNLDL